jgi:hypothetical protein
MGDLVLFLGEDRTFYLKKKFLASSFNDINLLLEILKNSVSRHECIRKLRDRGITHILYYPKGLDRMARMSPVYRLTKDQISSLNNFLLSLAVVYNDKDYRLYQVKN